MIDLAPVPEYPKYLATSHGQIWSSKSRKFLKPIRNRDGYYQVHLYPGGKTMLIHRLVLLAFVGPCPEGYQARHLNGEPDDPRLRNLIWGTEGENREDKIRHGTLHGAKGERNHSAKLTEEKVREIRRLHPAHSHRQLGKMFGVCPRTIRSILHRKKWRHVV